MMNQLEPLRDLIQGKKVAQPLRPRRSAPQRIDRQTCLELIHAILDGTEEPLSIRQLARHLGCRERVLTHHFPQECMLIAKHAQEYHKQRQEQRLQQVQDQVRQTVIALHGQGIFPSHRRLRMMFPPGVMRMPEANVAWHASLREIGLEQ
jgi:AraC-like DNA-binding protein